VVVLTSWMKRSMCPYFFCCGIEAQRERERQRGKERDRGRWRERYFTRRACMPYYRNRVGRRRFLQQQPTSITKNVTLAPISMLAAVSWCSDASSFTYYIRHIIVLKRFFMVSVYCWQQNCSPSTSTVMFLLFSPAAFLAVRE